MATLTRLVVLRSGIPCARNSECSSVDGARAEDVATNRERIGFSELRTGSERYSQDDDAGLT
jgi:hypothetical protein